VNLNLLPDVPRRSKQLLRRAGGRIVSLTGTVDRAKGHEACVSTVRAGLQSVLIPFVFALPL
jgi:hypothetical protein